MKSTQHDLQPKRSRRVRRFVLGAVVALLLVWLGVAATLWYQGTFTTKNVTEREVVENDGNALSSSEETTISGVVEKVSESIVSIVTEVETGNAYWGYSVQEGAGSGMIVSADGYVLTNKHVIDGARQVQVVLQDGTTYNNTRVVMSDPLNDIAFLKINGVKDLKPVELGDSTTVKIGQRVIAIGNSLGQYQNTVTSGIISGTGRPVAAQGATRVETLTDLLQTDAAINPGNSGGPLLNTAGQVVGVNTAVAADAEGIGFAIPISATKGLIKQLLDGKEPQRAYLGVRYIPVNGQLAKKYELSVSRGAYVMSETSQAAVVSDSPADKAGIKKGDVITKVGDVEVGPRGGVSSLVAEYAPGDTIELTYQRGDQTRTTRVTLAAYEN